MPRDIYRRFNVRIGERQTSISMSPVLVRLLELRLDTLDEGKTVRGWCQEKIGQDPGEFSERASARLTHLAILETARPELVEQYWQERLDENA